MTAEIAFWYGVNPYQMTHGQILGLYANLRHVQAQKQIHDRQFEGLDHEGIYQLYLDAYDDEQIASKARTRYLEDLVRRSCNAASSKGRQQ